ncbi:MAG TPA: TonB-dependent receptor [Steroidobacteraceae bacterium]|nr:TonB-dependent receptor [Steroidobacteraceae bacterium]
MLALNNRSGVVGLALTTLLVAAPVAAQESQATRAQDVLEEVTVNARRVSEDVQRVPLTLTALKADTLEAQDIKDLFTSAKDIPALDMCCGAGSSTFLAIRGIQGVVTYFADAPYATGGFGDFLDISNVEILKGPQGTLFGIASNGGAIVIEPNKPGNELAGNLEVVDGTFGRRSISGFINVPVISEKLLVRAAFETTHRDGYITDIGSGESLGDQNYSVARVSAILRPVDGLQNYTMVHYYTSYDNPVPSGVPIKWVNPNGFAALVFGLPTLENILAKQNTLGNYAVAGLSIQPHEWAKQMNVVNTTTYDLSNSLTIKNIFSYQRNTGRSINDTDGTVLPLLDGSELNGSGRARTGGDEIQLQGKALAEKLSYTAGAIYSSNFNNSGFRPNAVAPVPNYQLTFGQLTANAVDDEGITRALYGQANYDLSSLLDKLSVTAGYRYTWDYRHQTHDSLDPRTLASLLATEASGHFSAGSYTLSLQYQMTPQSMVFINNSKGYSSGGLQLTAPPAYRTYQPETLNNIEVGTKSTFNISDWIFRSNLSFYYGFYDNVQVTVQALLQESPPPAPPVYGVLTQNAATGRIQGFDGDFTVVPARWLELGLAIDYADDRYTHYETASATGQPIDVSSTPFILVPKIKFSARSTVHLPIGSTNGDLSATAVFSRQSTETFVALPAQGPWDQIPAYDNLDVNIRWREMLGHKGLEASLFGTNLTKNVVAEGHLTAYENLGIASGYPAIPRMFGARLAYGF